MSSLSSAAEQRKSRNSSRWKRKTGTDREEEVEEKGEVESKRVHHVDDHGWRYEMRSELEP